MPLLFLTPPLCCGGHRCRILRKKGIFLELPMFKHLFIFTYNFPCTEKRALRQGSRQFLPCCNKLLQPPLRSVASLGQLWPGMGLERACKVMKSSIPPPKLQRAKPKAGYGQGTLSGSLWYLQAVPVLSLQRGVALKIVRPLMGLGIWDSTP